MSKNTKISKNNNNIIMRCQEIYDEMKRNYESCKEINDNEIIKAIFDLNNTQIEVVENLSKLAATGPQKLKCYYTLAHLKSVKIDLEKLINKVGGGISNDNDIKVKWVEVDSAFNDYIKSGMIKNLAHIDIIQFFNDALQIFIEVINNVLRQNGGMIKVYTVLAATYKLVKNNEEDVKYFNTKAVSISASTDLNLYFKEYIETPLIKDMQEFQQKDSGWSL